MTRREVWAIGVGQCVSWGVLYYAFSVLIVPVERDLDVARWVIVGAFSVGLLVSALAAPGVGRLVDRGHGPTVMQAGGLIAAALLTLWAAMPSVWLSYLIWPALGVCMAAVLYEPVFAIVGRSIDHAGDRLRAIATITVAGGFASAVFLPLTASLVERYGWRTATIVLAGGLAMTTFVVHRLTRDATGNSVESRQETPSRQEMSSRQPTSSRQEEPSRQEMRARQGALTAIFTCSSFASAGLATNLVAALIERGLAPATAAACAGLFGVMQLPGRLLFMNRARSVSPIGLLVASLGLQVAGLLALMSSRSFAAIGTGVTLFACGSGLATLARPYLVLAFYGAERAGHMNGVFARAQQLARAGGPIGVAALASATGYTVVFASLAAMLSAVTMLLIDRKGGPAHC